MKKLTFLLLFLSGLLLFYPTLAFASADRPILPKVLYVPLDDRPVNNFYVRQIMQGINTKMEILPEKHLSQGRQTPANVEAAWKWIDQKASSCDIAVLSADTLIYGGLVASRQHHLNEAELKNRLEKFVQLKKKYPRLKIYVFSTVLRSPKASQGGVEPDYYTQYGPKIFRYTSLAAKETMIGITMLEQQEKGSLKEAIPTEYLQDWEERRAKNFSINSQLVELTQKDIISYLSLGRDDTAVYSPSTKEYQMLAEQAKPLYASPFSSLHKFSTFCGVDDLGLVLLARTFNHYRTVKVLPLYAPGVGAETMANYEDESIGNNVREHIFAAGAIPVTKKEQADLVFIINTPLDGKTREASSLANTITTEPTLFVQQIANALQEQKPVILADIAFSNGADNNLLDALKNKQLLYQFSGYSGWNTAGNSIGYALGQGLLSDLMDNDYNQKLLTIRYLDDWGYQSNVRSELAKGIIKEKKINKDDLNSASLLLEKIAQNSLIDFQKNNLIDGPTPDFVVSFPWNRLFEIKISYDI